MDSLSPPPVKKIRPVTNMYDMHIIECRREFNLPQQYPSMVTSNTLSNPSVLKLRNGANAGTTAASKSIKLVTAKEAPITSKLQRLRIKSKDGKDLGEINVHLLPRKEDSTIGKNLTFTNAELFHKINKSITFSAVPADKRTKVLCFSGAGKDGKCTKEAVVNKVAKDVCRLVSVQKTEGRSQKKVLLTTPVLIATKNITVEHMDSSVENGKNNIILSAHVQKKTVEPAVSKEPENVQQVKQTQCKKIVKSTKKSTSSETNAKIDSTNSESMTKKHNVEEKCRTESGGQKIPAKTLQHKQLAESKFPLVKCEKLVISKGTSCGSIKTTENQSDMTVQSSTKSKSVSPPPVTSRKEQVEKSCKPEIASPPALQKHVEPEKSMCNKKNEVKMESRDHENNIQKIKGTNFVGRLHSKTKQKKNVITVIPKAKSPQKRSFKEVERENETPVANSSETVFSEPPANQDLPSRIEAEKSNTEEKDCPQKAPHKVVLKAKSGLTTRNFASRLRNNANAVQSSKNELCDQWNIIKQAVSSVTDEDLRAKALKALADCGIGMERHVPLKPPVDSKAVHDTQIQTDVFGLLDPKSFVLVKVDTPNIERINQTQRTLPPVINDTNSLPLTRNLQNAFLENENLFPGPSIPPYDINHTEFDSFFNDICNRHLGASQVNQVLSTPCGWNDKISAQLIKDLRDIKQWDENGTLNIHRAVASNSVNDVQRLLLVLKACKENIDATTAEGMTSLELAIEAGSSMAIVKHLLQAGAQPVLPEPAHDSALILASKKSSPLLPELLNYVRSRDLLDKVGSEGFAPLHYCALKGNLEGAMALLRAGASVNLKDNRSGRTPFFHAVENNEMVIAQKLLDHGAITNIPNFSGQTALSLATTQDHFAPQL